MDTRPRTALFAAAVLGLALAAGCERNREPKVTPAGDAKTATTKVLEAGSDMLQGMKPLGRMNMYLVGFHPMKGDPGHSMEAHHFCTQVNEDFAQCVLFDGNTPDANMNGIEYIISEKVFETLPPEERQYWHPHNYEILSGQLVAPGVPEPAEKQAMAKKMNSYGKTWHVWMTGASGKPGDKLPLGPPQLAWSYNADGEMPPAMLADRDQRMKIDSEKKKQDRADLVNLAHPQEGVDALAKAFPNRVKPKGVEDKAEKGPAAQERGAPSR